MRDLVILLLVCIASVFKSHRGLEVENLALGTNCEFIGGKQADPISSLWIEFSGCCLRGYGRVGKTPWFL